MQIMLCKVGKVLVRVKEWWKGLWCDFELCKFVVLVNINVQVLTPNLLGTCICLSFSGLLMTSTIFIPIFTPLHREVSAFSQDGAGDDVDELDMEEFGNMMDTLGGCLMFVLLCYLTCLLRVVVFILWFIYLFEKMFTKLRNIVTNIFLCIGYEIYLVSEHFSPFNLILISLLHSQLNNLVAAKTRF